jgi:hypothetical protein
MNSTLQQQTDAIRLAIKALNYEITKMLNKGVPATDEAIVDMRFEARAMSDAIEALRAAEAFKISMKSFLGVA